MSIIAAVRKNSGNKPGVKRMGLAMAVRTCMR
jgi:hypothetical protein